MPLEFRRDITLYGKSNLYPQMVQEIMFRSPITSSAVNSLSDFTFGEGFENAGDLIINDKEMTLDDLLKIVASQDSTYDGWALHFNVDELFNIVEINPVDFKSVRYGLPSGKGRHHDVVLNNNWENDQNKTLRKGEHLSRFPLWNMRNSDMFEMPEEFEEFNGFILYHTPEPDQYPKCTFDPVLDSAQTNAEVQTFELGNIQNGFLGAGIFLHRGKIESSKERQQLEHDLRQLQGPENANSVMIAEVPVDFEGELIEQLAANNNDRLFELTNSNVTERILANFAQPYPISGIQPPGGGIFNQEQMMDATIYYNAKTRNRRISITKAFNKFMEFWAGGAVDVGGINEIKWDEEQVNTEQDGGDQTNNN